MCVMLGDVHRNNIPFYCVVCTFVSFVGIELVSVVTRNISYRSVRFIQVRNILVIEHVSQNYVWLLRMLFSSFLQSAHKFKDICIISQVSLLQFFTYHLFTRSLSYHPRTSQHRSRCTELVSFSVENLFFKFYDNHQVKNSKVHSSFLKQQQCDVRPKRSDYAYSHSRAALPERFNSSIRHPNFDRI